MALGKEELEWERVSHMLAMIHNCNQWDSSKVPKQPRDFNPFFADEERQQIAQNDEALAIIERETSGQ